MNKIHLEQLSFNELRKMAKSIRGIGKYGYLNKTQLIDQIIKTKKPKTKTQTKKDKLPEVLNQLSFNELRKMAKSIRGIGKYGNLNKTQLIDKIIKTKKPQPKSKPQIKPKPKKDKLVLNQLSFNELRKMAKSIRGIGKYGNLNKTQLIDKILKTKKTQPKPKPQIKPKPKKD